jgi:TrpR-related protein YerC/YecD
MNARNDTRKIKELMEAMQFLKTPAERESFFRDLLTEKELLECCNRWRAARMLWDKSSYAEISRETGLSSTTIARVSRWLRQGKGGYQKVLKRWGGTNVHIKPFFQGKGSG